MWNEGFTVVGVSKAANPEERAGGGAYEHLPSGMGGQSGPTAYRAVADPLARLAASNIRADAISRIIREMRKPWLVPQNKRAIRRHVRQSDLVSGERMFF